MDLSDQDLYDRFLGMLATNGAVGADGERGVVVITELEGHELDPPMRFHIDPEIVGRTVREIATGSYVQPGMDPVSSSIGLFLLHVDEAVATARDGETELVVVSYGVESVRPDGTRTPFSSEVEELIALNDFHERLIQYYADRGEMELDVGYEILIVHDLDGRAFQPPLRVHATSAEMRTQLRAAEDRETTWQTIVDAIDRLAATVDTRTTMVVLTPDGVLARELADPPSRPREGLGWSAYAPGTGESYPPG